MRLLLPLALLTACGGGVICPAGQAEVDGVCVDDLDEDGIPDIDDDVVDTDGDGEDDRDDDDPDDDDPDDDDEPDEDGDDDPDVGDLIEDAQPCDGLEPGDRLDVLTGCVDGVCAQRPWATAIEAFRRPERCAPGDFDNAIVCGWTNGVEATGIDVNQSGELDRNDYLYSLRVEAPWGGAGPDGLGLGVSPGCFVEVLGTPTAVTLQTVPGEEDPWASYAWWADTRVAILDQNGGPQPFVPDGRVDAIVMFGPAPR